MNGRHVLDVAANYARVCERVATAAERCGRKPADVRIVCAAKKKAAELVQLAIQAGATDIGENYVQEAQRKMGAVTTAVRWHLIGHLQRNKARLAVPMFSLVHSLDGPDLAIELERQAKKRGIRVRALIEINAAGEDSTPTRPAQSYKMKQSPDSKTRPASSK